MNENFKKLLEQSYSKAFEECIQRGHQVKQIDAIFNSIAMDEFAELIVRECVEWCDAYATIDGTAQQIRDAIKNHFGVE